jgi:hypothetical protein
MTQEKEKPKIKIKLFDYIFESSIKSSKTISSIVTELIAMANDVNSLRISIINLSKVIQIHQQALDDITKAIEITSSNNKKNEIVLSSKVDTKKDKPN